MEGLDKDPNCLKETMGVQAQNVLYVGNIPYHFDKTDLEDLFRDCGDIKQIDLPKERQYDRSKGFAFVVFETDKGARKASNYDGHKVLGRPLRINIAKDYRDPSLPM